MMQAEEIIQQKEWQQLSDAEKAFLAPLASDEAEYNLLKKMLLVSAEEVSAVPGISPDVQQRLQNIIAGKPAVHFLKRWHYAAAAVLLILATTWFVLQNKNEESEMARQHPVDIPVNKQQFRPVNTDTPAHTVLPSKDVTNDKTATIKKEPGPIKQTPVATHPRTIPSPQNELAVNTTVGRHPGLMQFITEVYE